MSFHYRWSAIAARMPGRTDNEIKNHWHTNLKKRSQQHSATEPQLSSTKDKSPTEPIADDTFQSFHATQDCSPISQNSSSSTSAEHNITTLNENHFLQDEFAFWNADTDLMSGDFWLEPYMLDTDIISYVSSEPEYFSPAFDAELWSHDN